MTGFVGAERESGIHFLQDLHAACFEAYRAACKFDGLSPYDAFAVFSDENPYVVFYDKGMAVYARAAEEFRQLGYCGAIIKGGKAELYKRKRPKRAAPSGTKKEMSETREMLTRRRDEIREAMKPLEAEAASLRGQLATIEAKLRPFGLEVHDIDQALRVLRRA